MGNRTSPLAEAVTAGIPVRATIQVIAGEGVIRVDALIVCVTGVSGAKLIIIAVGGHVGRGALTVSGRLAVLGEAAEGLTRGTDALAV